MDDQTQVTQDIVEETAAGPTVEQSPVMDGTNEAPVEAQAEPTTEEVTEQTEPAEETAETPAEEVAETVQEDTQDQPTKPTASPASNVPADAKWYIVHTYSGHENKVARGIEQRAETMGYTEKIFDIIVPTREVTKVSQGKKSQVQEKIFPGYVLVRMILTDETWLMVRTTQGVTAFIGAGNKPTPISEKEVEAIQKFMKLEEPLYKTGFSVNEAVKIVDGPFADFLGTIESIDDAKGKLRVLVSIFGRETPVELDFLQVAKI